MKNRYLYLLLALTLVPLLLTSCKDDDEEVAVSDNCIISSVTLGSLQRTVYGSEGTTSTVTYSGSLYRMVIDQRAGVIVNSDSLPDHTQLSSVALTVNFDGILSWRRASEEGAAWTAFSSGDALDLTTPVKLRVFATSGSSYRDYTLTVNVHQQRGDSTVWQQDADLASGLKERKLLVWNNRMNLWADKGETTLTYLWHADSQLDVWTEEPTTGTEGAVPSTLQLQGNTLYMSTQSGALISSTDGKTWTAAPHETKTGLTLVGATEDYLYALCDQNLWRSNGGAWTLETLDDAGSNLPVSALNTVSYTLPNGLKRLLLVGTRSATDTQATLWAKTWEVSSTGSEETTATWVYYTPNDADKYRLSALEHLAVVPYDGGLQALGGKSADGQLEALSNVYHSNDHGITWKTYVNDDMTVDATLQEKAKTAQYWSVAVDEEQWLWVTVDEQVWRGRINRLGFVKK